MTRSTMSRLCVLSMVLPVLGGCQIVTDFDESRICRDQSNMPVDCRNPRNVPDGLFDIAGRDLECVAQACDEASGQCVFPADPSANGDPCDPGDPCVLNPTCSDGVCTGDPAPDGTVCDDSPCMPGVCMDGACVVDSLGEGAACDDGIVCTTDSVCEIAVEGSDRLVCNGDRDPDVPNGTECDDSDPCTINTECFNGRCLGNDVECPDGEICDPSSGDCVDEGALADAGTPM